jgi:general stress protein YciG
MVKKKSPLSEEARQYFREQGKKGGKKSGKARMEKLTPEQRSEIAKKAGKAGAAARWAKKVKASSKKRTPATTEPADKAG